MRIIQLAPLWKTVPPLKYGGSELIVSLLTEELVKNKLKVKLIAAGGCNTRAELIEPISKPLYELLGKFDFESVPFADILSIACALELAKNGEADLIHNHMGFHTALLGKYAGIPVVTTLHSSVPPDNSQIAIAAEDEKYISISYAQRKLAPYLNYVDNIYHGIDVNSFDFEAKPNNYLAYFATMREEKGADRAIDIALESGLPLIMAGDIRNESDYEKLKPRINGTNIKYIGELDFKQKNKLLKGALAYLFPIRWNEAFGLTIAESLACGTPVIAWTNGSAPEIIQDGKTGFLVNSISAAVEAVKNIVQISRLDCRCSAEERFDKKIMAQNYINLYEEVIR